MHPANKLFTKTAFKNVPQLHATDEQGDEAIVYVKLFSQLNGWLYYITEFDPKTGEAFGLVKGFEIELGTIPIGLGDDQWSGEAMQDINNDFRSRGFPYPPFERDLHWKPTKLGIIREKLNSKGWA